MKCKIEGFSKFLNVGIEHLGTGRSPDFLENEVFAWFQRIPRCFHADSKAEKSNQFLLQHMEVVGKIKNVRSMVMEDTKEVKDVWLTTMFRVQNGGKKSKNAVELPCRDSLDEGIAALQVMVEQGDEFLVQHGEFGWFFEEDSVFWGQEEPLAQLAEKSVRSLTVWQNLARAN